MTPTMPPFCALSEPKRKKHIVLVSRAARCPNTDGIHAHGHRVTHQQKRSHTASQPARATSHKPTPARTNQLQSAVCRTETQNPLTARSQAAASPRDSPTRAKREEKQNNLC